MSRGFTASELVDADSSCSEIDVAADQAMAPGVADVVVVTEELNVSFVVRATDENHGSLQRLGQVELPSTGNLPAFRSGLD